MKTLISTVAFAVLLAGTANAAPKRATRPQAPDTALLLQGLKAMMPVAASAGPPAKTEDHDQGDDHASPRAILVVCSKSTPAARRSAICPVEPVTPD